MRTKAEKKAIKFAWYINNPDKVDAQRKRSRAKKAIKKLASLRAVVLHPIGKHNLKDRRLDLWKKFKSGQLAPDIAARVSKDYAKEFAEFEAEAQKLSSPV